MRTSGKENSPSGSPPGAGDRTGAETEEKMTTESARRYMPVALALTCGFQGLPRFRFLGGHLRWGAQEVRVLFWRWENYLGVAWEWEGPVWADTCPGPCHLCPALWAPGVLVKGGTGHSCRALPGQAIGLGLGPHPSAPKAL